MVESYLTNAMIVAGEPMLADEYRSGQSSWDNIRYESFNEMLQDLSNMNLEIRRLCIRLPLQTSVTKTAAYNGAESDRDYLNRIRLIIDTTAITADASGFVFALQGRNSSDDSYADVVTDITVDATGTSSTILTTSTTVPKIYKYYRIRITTADTTITFSADLVEDTYTNLHRLRARMNIYHSLQVTYGEGEYVRKYEAYKEMYEEALANWKFPYDETDDEEISEDESEENITQNITFR